MVVGPDAGQVNKGPFPTLRDNDYRKCRPTRILGSISETKGHRLNYAHE